MKSISYFIQAFVLGNLGALALLIAFSFLQYVISQQ